MEVRHSASVNSAARFARLLQQAKTLFGLLTTVKIGPPFASVDGQPGEPGSELLGINHGRSRKKNGVTPPRRALAFAQKCRYLFKTKDAD